MCVCVCGVGGDVLLVLGIQLILKFMQNSIRAMIPKTPGSKKYGGGDWSSSYQDLF